MANSKLTSWAVNKPSGLNVGDLLLVFLGTGDGSSVVSNFVPPTGVTTKWQLIVANYGAHTCFAAWYKYADSSDVLASSYTFSWTGLTGVDAIVGRMPNPAASNPIDTFSYVEWTTAAGVFTTNSITTTFSNENLFTLFSQTNVGQTWTLPAGETAFGNSPVSYMPAAGDGIAMCSGTEAFNTPGTVPAKTADSNNTTNYGSAFIVAIKTQQNTNYTRSVSSGVGCAASAARRQVLKRAISTAIHAPAVPTRSIGAKRSASSAVGNSATAGRKLFAHRNAQVFVQGSASARGRQVLKRAINTSVDAKVTPTRRISAKRSTSASVANSVTVGQKLNARRVIEAFVQGSAAAGRRAVFHRSSASAVQSDAQARRKLSAVRMISVSLGVSAWAAAIEITRRIRQRFNRLFGIGIGP
jgi:hypothetical protein